MQRLTWLLLALGLATPVAAQELLVNGSFENPPILQGTVSYYSSIPGWQTEPGPPIEVQNNCCGLAYAGNQLVELDSNSSTSTAVMYQDIVTQPGRSYTLRLAYSPRPRNVDNRIEVWWDGSLLATLSRDGSRLGGTSWSLMAYSVTATQATTRLRFADVSVVDTVGGYLDAISLIPEFQIQLSAVFPASGSEAGSDLVHLTGMHFTNVADTVVTFGGAPATVLTVASDQMTVLTPSGTGVVDVSATNINGSATLMGAYTYVAPEIAARFGNVNVGLGDRENVLLVNSVPGDANREVSLSVGEPFTVTLSAPSSRVRARFALYVWRGAAGAAGLRPQPAGLGNSVFPTPLNAGDSPQPLRIGNNLDARLGASDFTTSPAPSTIGALPTGWPSRLVVTLQGIIQDNGSQIPQSVSLTNAVILRIHY